MKNIKWSSFAVIEHGIGGTWMGWNNAHSHISLIKNIYDLHL